VTDSYVILTGSKNNAGDFLIKYRAQKIFEAIRPDREIIDFNGWENFDDTKLAIINKSKVLILMGGPALQKDMVPNIYALPDDLDKIKVPIITMGIGWKSVQGDWFDTYNYSLSERTVRLLKRISNDGLSSSVRDFHTLNALTFKEFDNYLMTGCPAYYDLKSINTKFSLPESIKKVAFSLGVSFVHSNSMDELMKSQILAFKEKFPSADFQVVFHHALYTGEKLSRNKRRHSEFASWLDGQSVRYVDISGCAENLINYYSEVDLHVGYRVHAHIFMSSIKKMSLLFSEDGRAKGSRSAISGMVVDGYLGYKTNSLSKVLNKLIKNYDRYEANPFSTKEAIEMVDYEVKSEGQRSKLARQSIDQNFLTMKDFLQQLP